MLQLAELWNVTIISVVKWKARVLKGGKRRRKEAKGADDVKILNKEKQKYEWLIKRETISKNFNAAVKTLQVNFKNILANLEPILRRKKKTIQKIYFLRFLCWFLDTFEVRTKVLNYFRVLDIFFLILIFP